MGKGPSKQSERRRPERREDMKCQTTGLITKPEFSRFLFYKFHSAIPLFAAFYAIFKYSEAIWWPLIYIGLCLLHVLIMFTIKCPHCAYYRIGGRMHRCTWIWGLPRIYKERTGPPVRVAKFYPPIGMLTLTLFPVYWLSFQWELLIIFLSSIVALFLSIPMHECTKCISFHCPNNRVPEPTRKIYLETGADRTAGP